MNGPAYWDRHAKNYDRSMLVLGRPMARMLELVRHAARAADETLEVAAGTGLVTLALAREVRHVVATDYSATMIEVVEKRVTEHGFSNVVCEQADLYALKYPPGSFDVVVAANVLHLVPDLEAALASLRRVLRAGGKLVVPTFCHGETLLSRTISHALAVTSFPGHRRFTSTSLRSALENAGVVVGHQEVLRGAIPITYIDAVAQGSSGSG